MNFYHKILFVFTSFVICFLGIAQENTSFITKELVTGKVNYAELSYFKTLPKEFSSKEIYLQKEVVDKFVEMCNAAKQSGIRLVAISGARNFTYQKNIWERKWKNSSVALPNKKAKNILEYSAMPLASRHHWGTDIDINSVEPAYFLSQEGKKVYEWLNANAHKFGFCQVYNSSSQRQGYKPEKWHWSYMPIARECLSFYLENVRYTDFKGFAGSEFAKDVQIIEHYVRGINPLCDDLVK